MVALPAYQVSESAASGRSAGHACAGMAAVLGYLFPEEAQFFNDRAQEAGASTFDAGITLSLMSARV
jgi:hypothetical protein